MIKKGIAVIGSTTKDKIVCGDLSEYKIGGVTAYAGITYSRHGIKTLAVTNIAKQDADIKKCLHQEKMMLCNRPTEATTHFINTIDRSRRGQRLLQRAKPISRAQIIASVKDLSFLHLGPLHPSDIDIEAIKALSRMKLWVILDVQGFIRSVKNKVVYPVVSKHLDPALKISHIVKANQQEYRSIIDYYQTNLADIMTRFNINEFVVTSGQKGGFVRMVTGEKTRYDAAAVKSIGDPTGAGDIFLAAYVISRFLDRKTTAAACRYAAKLVGRQIEGNYIKPETLRLDSKRRN
jgi:sugar/nucleoside kinase (ribokinase family)